MTMANELPPTAQIHPAATAMFRGTFLRGHVTRHLYPGVTPLSSPRTATQNDPVRDILAFDDLRQDLEAEFRQQYPAASDDERRELRRCVVELTRPERFFYGYQPLQLYRPVGIYRSGDDPKNALTELSDLILHLEVDENPTGILLSAGSGSGKTVAMWKAWFDCLFAWIDWEKGEDSDSAAEQAAAGNANRSDDDLVVKLAGHLPCWLEPWHATEKLSHCVETPLEFVLSILAASCGLMEFRGPGQRTLDATENKRMLNNLKAWLKWSPPLLLFCDLNHISNRPLSRDSDETLRTLFADGLAAFQHQYSKYHRVIVAYRSQSQDDPAASRLRAQFTAYDLQRLEHSDAISYLKHLREFEKGAYQAGRLTVPERHVDQEVRKLSDLISRTVREEIVEVVERDEAGNEVRRFERQVDPVISTPLMMNWVGQLQGESLHQVENVCDLYREVVNRFLNRIRDNDEQGLSKDERERLLIGMTRIALVLLAQDGETRVNRDVTEEALLYPDTGEGVWWPEEFKLSHDSEYCQYNSFRKQDIAGLLESGIFRRDDSGLGFMHDSLIHYFGAIALHEYHEPGRPTFRVKLADTWSDQIAALFIAHPARWMHPAGFLGGALHRRQSTVKETACEVSRRIMEALVLATPQPDIPKLLTGFLSDQQTDPLLRQTQLAILDSSGFAISHHESLLQAVYNRLRWMGVAASDECRETAGSLLSVSRRTASRRPPWLRLAKARSACDVLTASNSSEAINCVAALSDGRVAYVESDRLILASKEFERDEYAVHVWDPRTGDIRSMDGHLQSVTCVAAIGDNRVVSASCDNTVKVWELQTGESRTMSEHSGEVRSVAVLHDGCVVSGSGDNTVKVWDWRTGKVLTMDEHSGAVQSVAVLGDGRVVSGSWDHTVRVWSPQTGDVLTMSENLGPVFSVAALTDGRVVFGGMEGVKVWDPRTGDVLRMAENSVIMDGPVSEEYARMWAGRLGEHSAPVMSVAVIDDENVVCGGAEGVKVWNLRTGKILTMCENVEGPWFLAMLKDGRVVSEIAEREMCVWNPHTSTWRIMTRSEHSSIILSVAVMDDGRVVSGNADGMVQVWDSRTGEVLMMCEHAGPVLSVAALSDSHAISGSSDCTVKVWDVRNGGNLAIREHSGIVTSAFVLDDGRVVSGSADGAVKLWDLQTGEVATMCEHSCPVVSVAALSDGSVVSGAANTVKVWDPRTGEVATMCEDSAPVVCVAALNDGFVAYSCAEGVRVWNSRTGEVATMNEHSNGAMCVIALRDGRVVSGGADTVKVWNPQTGEVATMCGDSVAAFSLAALGDDQVVFGSITERTVNLWNLRNGEVATICEHSKPVVCVAALSDGSVVSGAADTVKVRVARTGDILVIPLQPSRCIRAWPNLPRFMASAGHDLVMIEIEPWPDGEPELLWPDSFREHERRWPAAHADGSDISEDSVS